MENQNLTIELPVAAWNVIMNALCGRPFGEVHEIIGEITAVRLNRCSSPYIHLTTI